jgi:hypothetical protein
MIQSDVEARIAHLKLRLARIRAGHKLSKLQRLSYEESLRVEREARRVEQIHEFRSFSIQR